MSKILIPPKQSEKIATEIGKVPTVGLEIVPLNVLKFYRIIQLAARYKITTYDSIYLEVARIAETQVLTADHPLLNRVKQLTRSLT